jgi:hypothetical protein
MLVCPLIRISIHKYKQSILFVYICRILSLLHVSVRLDHHQVILIDEYIFTLLQVYWYEYILVFKVAMINAHDLV